VIIQPLSYNPVMKTPSSILAHVVVLCFVSEAGAQELSAVSYTISIGGETFGFADWYKDFDQQHFVFLGPLGKYRVFFTATQGLVGFCLIVVGLVVLVTLVTLFTFRWRRKRAT
jgi:hypothetical protein